MKTLIRVFILLAVMSLVSISTLNCLEVKTKGREDAKDDVIVPKGADTSQHTALPSEGHLSPGRIFEDTVGNKINYGSPELYLKPGAQSDLNEEYLNQINRQITIGSHDTKNVGAIFKWKQSYFETYAAGGQFIGKITVNQIMEKRALSGCHDHGLVLVSILREYGFPAIMVDTAGIAWALDYSEGKQEGFRGHVFVEVWVKDQWILINSTSGEYVGNYDPCNPVIPMTDSAESKGYFALFKGLDPMGYGINGNEQLTENLKVFAGKVKSLDVSFPPYQVKRLP